MAITTSTDDLNIIAALDDEPNDVGGLTAAQLKAKFDEAVLDLQTYINTVLIPLLDAVNLPYQYGVASTIKDQMDAIVAGSVSDGSITTAKLDDEAVTDVKLAASAVTDEKIADGSVTLSKLADAAKWFNSLCAATSNTTITAPSGSPQTVTGTASLTASYDPLSAISSNSFVVPSGIGYVLVFAQGVATVTSSTDAYLAIKKNSTTLWQSRTYGDEPEGYFASAFVSVSAGDVISVFLSATSSSIGSASVSCNTFIAVCIPG